MSLYSRAEKVMRPALCSDTAMDLLQEADATIAAKDAEIASLIAANGDLQRWFDAAFSEFGRKDAEIARLRDAIESCIPALEIGRDAAHVISVFGDDRGATIGDALAKASAALAQVAEVGE